MCFRSLRHCCIIREAYRTISHDRYVQISHSSCAPSHPVVAISVIRAVAHPSNSIPLCLLIFVLGALVKELQGLEQNTISCQASPRP